MIADCQKCGGQYPAEDICEGLCLDCWDSEAGKHYFSAGALASKKCRDNIRYQNQTKPARVKLEHRD